MKITAVSVMSAFAGYETSGFAFPLTSVALRRSVGIRLIQFLASIAALSTSTPSLSTAATIPDSIYWAETSPRRISRVGIEDRTIVDLITTLPNQPVEFELDAEGQQMYWRINLDQRIWRAGLDGTNPMPAFTWPTGTRQLVFEPHDRKFYWQRRNASDEMDTIYRAELDGSETAVLSVPDFSLGAFAIAPVAGKVYWATPASGAVPLRAIHSANFDGTEVETLTTGLRYLAVTVDEAHGKVYWSTVDTGDRRIQWANLDGSGLEDFLTQADMPAGVTFTPTGKLVIDYRSEKLYWTNNISPQLMRSDLDGSNVEVFLSTNRGGIGHIALYQIPEPSSASLVVVVLLSMTVALFQRKRQRALARPHSAITCC
jgi:hypothetical protein